MATSNKDLEQRLGQLSAGLEKLSDRLDSKCEKVGVDLEKRIEEKVGNAALEYVNNIRTSIDHTIDSRFRTTWLLAGALMIILSAVGYFGIQSMVTKTLDDKVGRDTMAELEKFKSQARTAVLEIEKAQAVARSNPLIVLQTDFGAKSPYMGALMGAIYKVNP